VFEGVLAVVVTVRVDALEDGLVGRLKLVGVMLAVTVGSGGEIERVNKPVPVKEPLPLVPVAIATVVLTFVATPAVMFVEAGAAVSERKTLCAAGATQGRANRADRAATVRMVRLRVFMVTCGYGSMVKRSGRGLTPLGLELGREGHSFPVGSTAAP
jgi:hypothetical protein